MALLNRKVVGISAFVLLSTAAYFWIRSATTIRHLADNLIAAYLIAWGLFAFLSSIPRVEVAKRFALLTTTIGFFLLLLEAPAWLGLLDYRQIFSITEGFDTWDKPGFVSADEVLWLHEPHYRMQGQFSRGDVGKALCAPHNSPQTYDLRYDRNGFRNDSDLDSADIVVVGDSFVESPILASPALATSVLGQLQNTKVANLGISGYGPQQELGVLKRYAMALRPTTVVWLFYEGNDLEDAQEYESKAARLPKDHNRLARRFQRSFTRSALWAFLRTQRGCVPSRQLQERYGTVRDPQGMEQRIYFAYPALPLSQNDLNALAKARSVLAEAHRLCRERGIRLIFLFAPTEYRVYQGIKNLTTVSDEVKTWVINDLPERLRTIVTDISPEIQYVDLTPILRSRVASGTPVFLSDDTHWSPDGHRIIAQTIHTLLSSSMAAAR